MFKYLGKNLKEKKALEIGSGDGLLKNFMTNFLKQFNNPTHFGLYKVLSNNVEQGVDNLRTMLQSREKPEHLPPGLFLQHSSH